MKHLAALAVLVSACTAAVPDHPTYVEDVQPIVEANCVRCHAAPTAVKELRNCVRLDQWDSTPDTAMKCSDSANMGMILGVHDAGPMIVAQVTQHRMPIDGPALSSRQIDIFQRWADGGFRKRATNSPPTITFSSPPAAGVTVCNPVCTTTVAYDVSDPDGDAVTWSLGWSSGGRSGTFATGLTGGTGSLTIDATTLASGTYTLVATLDDGTVMVMVDAPGTLTVPAGHNAPPVVTVIAPNGGESYYQGAAVAISWTGSDPDDATLSYDVAVLQGTTSTTVATGISAPVGQTAMTTWTAPMVAGLTSYVVQVTATDGGSPALTATDMSDAPFTVSPPPQTVSFASQLQPILTASCATTACHAGVHPQQGLDLSAGKAYAALVNVASSECSTYKLVLPDQPDQSYLIFKLAGSGACFTGSQMPKGGAALSSAQQQLFRDWIANGAPNN